MSFDDIRNSLVIPAEGQVNISVGIDPRFRGLSFCARFECVPCGGYFEFDSPRCIYECLGCGYEMTILEAKSLCDSHIDHIKTLAGDTNHRRSFWRRLFFKN